MLIIYLDPDPGPDPAVCRKMCVRSQKQGYIVCCDIQHSHAFVQCFKIFLANVITERVRSTVFFS
jgi:hypothetical protein